jgi:hypothetical protein
MIRCSFANSYGGCNAISVQKCCCAKILCWIECVVGIFRNAAAEWERVITCLESFVKCKHVKSARVSIGNMHDTI